MIINRKTKVITYAILSMFFAFTLVLSIAEAYTSVKMWGSLCVLFHNSQQGCLDPDGAGPLELGDGQFYSPRGIDLDASGNNVYVADTGNDRIQRLDSNGNFITKWGTSGTGAGQFKLPTDIAVDASGDNVYVLDTGNDRIQKFVGNELIPTWGTEGTGDGQFDAPSGIALDSSDNVYVADTGNHRIQKFDSNGNFITKWGSVCSLVNPQFQQGCLDPDGAGPLVSGDGQFAIILGIAVDSSDNVYVTDYENARIQKFDSNGNFITKWGSEGTGDGQFRTMAGITVDSSDNVYVTDYFNNRIQKFDSNGNFITKWETPDPGTGRLFNPYGIAVDSSGNVYVTHLNGHVQVFTPSDNDNDGISNQVDYSFINGQYTDTSSIISSDFTDTVTGGTTFGTITTIGNQSLTISEYQNPQGVSITTTGGSNTPKTNITVCNGSGQYSLGTGANFISTCDSVHTSVLADSTPIIVLLTAADGSQLIAYLDAGDDLLFDTTTSTFTAISSNTEFILTSIDGQKQAIISLPAQNSVTVSASGFSFSAPSTNTLPVNIIIPTSIILNPGDIFTPSVPLTIQGFYPPVDMPGTQGVVNTIKAGSTVPLKFNVYDPNKNNKEITDVSIVEDIKATMVNTITTSSGSQISCGSAPVDDVELTTTDATNLRYDTVAKQFVMNWKSPKGQSGSCMQIALTLADNTSIGAYFRLK